MSFLETRPFRASSMCRRTRPDPQRPNPKTQIKFFRKPENPRAADPNRPAISEGNSYTAARDSHLPAMVQIWHTSVTVSRTKRQLNGVTCRQRDMAWPRTDASCGAS